VRLDEHLGRAHGPADPGRRPHAVYTRAMPAVFKPWMLDSFKPVGAEATIVKAVCTA
jgi:hypothetical protein